MEKMFIHDRLLDEADICNFRTEIDRLLRQTASGGCIRLYGLRNFGKTSILRNVLGKRWSAADETKRIFVYADFYSVTSMQDLSCEVAGAFDRAMSVKHSLLEKTKDWLSLLKNIRPTWSPDESGLGTFSFTTARDNKIPDFELILANIDKLQRGAKFEFCLVFDEFQEIAKIPKAEAKLRGVLQTLPPQIAVVISGSKPHLLKEIFENPKAPFHAWGNTIELGYIDYAKYHEYMLDRFVPAGKTIDLDSSRYMQDLMSRIPESINRICEFIRIDPDIKEINSAIINKKISEFLDSARTNYETVLASLTAKEMLVLCHLAHRPVATSVLSTEFLHRVKVSKTGVSAIIQRFLDRSIVYRLLDDNDKWRYQVSDPLLNLYIRKFKKPLGLY